MIIANVQVPAGGGLPVLDHLLPSCLLCTSLGRIWPQLVIVKTNLIISRVFLKWLWDPWDPKTLLQTLWDPMRSCPHNQIGTCVHCIRELWFRSIRLAQKHCKDPSWIYIDTTPFYAMVRFSGGSQSTSWLLKTADDSWMVHTVWKAELNKIESW